MESCFMFSLKVQMLLKMHYSDHIPTCNLLFVTQKYAESVDTLTRTTGQVNPFLRSCFKINIYLLYIGFYVPTKHMNCGIGFR